MATSPPPPPQTTLLIPKHIHYISTLDAPKYTLDYTLTEHLRLSGVYWGLTALHLLKTPQTLPRTETIAYVLTCHDPSTGGFSAHPSHDPHMLYTVSAIQILATLDALDVIDRDKVAGYIAGLQDRETGAFAGDEWGETDTRFVYGALNCLSLLGRLHTVDVEAAVRYVLRCRNYDGGFGMAPEAESHAGQIFTCLGVLAIAGKLSIDVGGGGVLGKEELDLLGEWLCERQLPNGGLNGRPEKLEDVCYSWWVLSSLAMIGRLHWIDKEKLVGFILECQDPERGGIADRPGDMVDVFHTVFGIAGLSLLGYPGLKEVDPVYCMPRDVTLKIVGR